MNITHSRFRVLLMAVVLGSACQAHAEPPVGKAATAPVVMPSAPLKGVLKLAPLTTPVPAVPRPDALDQAYERFKASAERARLARDTYVTAREQCTARSFSVQDQRQAGCQESDTVGQCNARLESWCTRREYRGLIAQSRLLKRAANELRSVMDAYITESRQLPESE